MKFIKVSKNRKSLFRFFKSIRESRKEVHKKVWFFFKTYRKSKHLKLRKKSPYSELLWSVFSRIWTEYREILFISPYSVWMRQNKDQNNSEQGHFLRSVKYKCFGYFRLYYWKASTLKNFFLISQNVNWES